VATRARRNLFGREHVLEDLKRRFDRGLQNIASIDQKLQSLLSSASLIFSLTSVIQVSQFIQSGHPFFVFMMALALLFYVLMLVTILWGLRVISADEDQYLQPISKEWNHLEGQYFDRSKYQVLEEEINSYLAAIADVEDLISRKRTNLTIAVGFFAAITLLIAVSIAVGASTLPSVSTSPTGAPTAFGTLISSPTLTSNINPPITSTPSITPSITSTPF
jgi:hypothetical protein